MGIVDEGKALMRAATGDPAPAFVAPRAGSFAIPDDIGLGIEFPEGVSDSPDKLVYVLWREGSQCYANLRLLTGLAEPDFRSALNALVDSGFVESLRVPAAADGFEDHDEMRMFALRARR